MLSLGFPLFLCVAIILFKVNANIFVNIDSDGDNSILGTHFYYEGHFENITYDVKSLNRDNHLLRRELNAVNVKMDREMAAQMDELLEIQELIKTRVIIKAPTSCAEAMQSTTDHTGVYRLHLPDLPPFEVLCLKDPKNGKAWTIVQKRQDGSIDFYREWVDYKNGFGNFYGEFWLGLDKLHALTAASKQQLWIYIEDFDGEVRTAMYNSFAIGDEKSKYIMHTLGNYTGDAGDSLRLHFNSKFSTKDVDNDNSELVSCARVFAGAWWFNECGRSDLNAKYLLRNDPEIEQARGIQWFSWRAHYSMKRVYMAIRPIATK